MKINTIGIKKNNFKPKLSLDGYKLRKICNQNIIQPDVLKIHAVLPKEENIRLNLIEPHRHSKSLIKPQRLSIASNQLLKQPNNPTNPNVLNDFSVKRISLKSIDDKSNCMQVSNQIQIVETKPVHLQVVRHRSKTTSSPSTSKITKNTLNLQPLQEYEGCKQPFIEIEECLKRENLIQPYHSLYINIRRQKFHQIIIKIVRNLLASKNKKQPNFDLFKINLEIIKNTVIKKEGGNNRLSLVKNIFNFQYNSKKYDQEWNKNKATLDELQKITNNLQAEITYKKEMLTQINENQSIRLQQISRIDRQEYAKNMKLRQQESQLAQMEQKLHEMEKYLKEVQQKYHRMINYIETQDQNKILKLVSKDYVDIEADLYDYAVYLQHNQLANDIHYQPHPFTEIQRLIHQEMKVLNASIINNTNKSVVEKYAQMRDFVLYAMDKFKKKDAEMFRLNQFKTKCALTFIAKMKKWLNNWELKQEYLVNLKKDYAALTIAVSSKLKKMAQKQQELAGEDSSFRQDIKKLTELFEQLQINFSLGNSFY